MVERISMYVIRIAVGTAAVVAALFSWSCVEETVDDPDPSFNLEEEECIPGVDPQCPLDCEDVTTWPEEWLEASEEVVDRVNDLRVQGAECGDEEMPAVEPLAVNSALQEATRCHALDMAEHDELTHDGSDGSDEVERALRAGYPSDYVGENLAAGQTSAADVVDAWMESENHCVNLMHEYYRDTGVALVQLEGRMYWGQVFGR